MDISFLGKRKVLLAGAAVLILGGGVWGVVALKSGTKSKLPKELQQAIKAGTNDPSKMREVIHTAMQNGNLTEEQRHELFSSVHGAFEQQTNKRLDEYFAAVPANRQAILDQHIDEMQARMKEGQQHRPQGVQGAAGANDRGRSGRQRSNAPAATGGSAPGATPSAAGAPGPGGGGNPGFRGDRRGTRTHEQRKDHFESRSPDDHARRLAYFTAMQARAKERGIQMPSPGGRGGPGR